MNEALAFAYLCGYNVPINAIDFGAIERPFSYTVVMVSAIEGNYLTDDIYRRLLEHSSVGCEYEWILNRAIMNNNVGVVDIMTRANKYMSDEIMVKLFKYGTIDLMRVILLRSDEPITNNCIAALLSRTDNVIDDIEAMVPNIFKECMDVCLSDVINDLREINGVEANIEAVISLLIHARSYFRENEDNISLYKYRSSDHYITLIRMALAADVTDISFELENQCYSHNYDGCYRAIELIDVMTEFAIVSNEKIYCNGCCRKYYNDMSQYRRTTIKIYKLWQLSMRVRGMKLIILRCVLAESFGPRAFDVLAAYRESHAPNKIDFNMAVYAFMNTHLDYNK